MYLPLQTQWLCSEGCYTIFTQHIRLSNCIHYRIIKCGINLLIHSWTHGGTVEVWEWNVEVISFHTLLGMWLLNHVKGHNQAQQTANPMNHPLNALDILWNAELKIPKLVDTKKLSRNVMKFSNTTAKYQGKIYMDTFTESITIINISKVSITGPLWKESTDDR